MNRHFSKVIATVLIIAVAVPTTLFVIPSKAHAQQSKESCIGGLIGGVIGYILGGSNVPTKDKVTQAATGATSVATIGSCFYELVVVPMAKAAIRAVIRQMTASVVAWISGQSNGTGRTSFTQDLLGSLQGVGDIQALAFFQQFARNSNSPFATSIIASLKTQYLQNTSAAGFWAANRSTLSQYSPNVNAFLSGNWSQGGVGAWLALTTQTQNNPYMLYQASQGQLSSLVANAVSARTTTLNWGQGFMSWCGPSKEVEGPTAGACTSSSEPGDACTTASGVPGTCAASELGTDCVPKTGVNPGDSCYKSDGTAGQIQTPGSTIKDYTQKFVVDAGLEQLISAQDLDGAWNAIITALLNRVLSEAKGGLAGSTNSTATTRSIADEIGNFVPGTGQPGGSVSASVDAVLERVKAYESAWGKVKTSADSAFEAVSSALQACTEAASSRGGLAPRYVTQLQEAMPKVEKVRKDVQDALALATATKAFALQVKNEATTPGNTSYASNLGKLLGMPPSLNDLLAAEAVAEATGQAKADPEGTLAVSGGTPVDQMDLLKTNAGAYGSYCRSLPGVTTENGD